MRKYHISQIICVNSHWIMNLIFVIPNITSQGGTERTTVLLANHFVDMGYRVTIISFSRLPGLVQMYPVSSKVQVVFLSEQNYTKEMGIWKRFRFLVTTINKLSRFLKTSTFDVIISQSLMANVAILFSGFSKKSVACEHYMYNKYPMSIRLVRSIIYRCFRKVVVLTNHDAVKYRKHGIAAEVIPNMITFDLHENTGSNSKKIISVGRLMSQKGFDMLLPAMVPVFERHPDWHLFIYGEGVDHDALVILCDELSLQKNVTFSGFVKDIKSEYVSADFFVMSSRYEGFPMVLLEALSCGLPVVSFDCPTGPSEMLQYGAGLLVENQSISQLSASILKMIEDRELRNECAGKAHYTAQKYSPEIICRRWIDLFKGLSI